MKTLRLAAAAAVTVSLAGCSGMSIRTDYNPGADFTKYSTYAWLATPETGDARVDNALVEGRIKAAVDQALTAKGYRQVAPDQATFWVGYHLSIEGRMDVNTVNSYYGYGWGRGYYGPAYTDTQVYYYNQGTLLIDIVDAQAKELAWRGSAEAEVKPDVPPEERSKRINSAVAQVLERFPPK
jgi:hypothetical protein